MARKPKIVEPPPPSNTLVVDNGAYTLKAGFVSTEPDIEKDCHVIPNCMARGRDKKVWIGGQVEKCRDYGEMAFRRPVERGYLVNWEAEKEIWDTSFFEKDAELKVDPHDTTLVLTEAPNAPAALQANCDQMIFEEFEFASYYRCLGPKPSGPALNIHNDIPALFSSHPTHPSPSSSSPSPPVEAILLVDSGFSHTIVTPILRGRPIQAAIRRLDIGGKFLTNSLKELVSIRHYNMMDETHLMNEVKEAVSFVSSDFRADLDRTWRPGGVGERRDVEQDHSIVVDYVLPDYNTHKRGFMRPHDPMAMIKQRQKRGSVGGAAGATGDTPEDFMTLGNERFAVPELLFNPGDVGIKQAGVAEMVMQSLRALPGALWPALLAHVVVVGGNANIQGFVERLDGEIRMISPAECVVRVAKPSDPVTYTWLGGARFASDPTRLKGVTVSREEYAEHGAGWVARHFAAGG